jgi:Ribonuclease G/E
MHSVFIKIYCNRKGFIYVNEEKEKSARRLPPSSA